MDDYSSKIENVIIIIILLFLKIFTLKYIYIYIYVSFNIDIAFTSVLRGYYKFVEAIIYRP